ncbi:hypothetical protein E8E11_005544 [Didymella keratinophila]|nr:hypothetical protein E8E11_005544 [Didymella keratinophila]
MLYWTSKVSAWVKLDPDAAKIITRDFSVDDRGYFTYSGGVMLALRRLRPDLAQKKMLGHAIANYIENAVSRLLTTSKLRRGGKLNVDRDAPANARASKVQREQSNLPAHAPASKQMDASEPHRGIQEGSPGRLSYADGFESGTSFASAETSTPVDPAAPTKDLLARKLERLNMSKAATDNSNSVATPACAADDEAAALLLAVDSDEDDAETTSEPTLSFAMRRSLSPT